MKMFFYNEIVSRLFERSLHKENCTIYFSKRGNSVKQEHFEKAIQSSILNFENKNNKKVETETRVLVQTPSAEPCLQVVDYMNWVIYRAFTKGDVRYYNFIKDKISFICDIYDFDKYPKNFYCKRNPFDIQKISPLELGD